MKGLLHPVGVDGTIRDRSQSTSRRWSSPTRKIPSAHISEVEFIDDGIGKETISSWDSITTIEPFENEDVSWDENEARQIQSIPSMQDYVEPWVSTRTLSNPVPQGTRLSWRSDPIASLSDWSIRVVVDDGHRPVQSTLYHCHSTVLVWGPRKCEAFIHLFQQRIKMVPPPRSTVIEISYTEAAVFPMFLDFLYCETTFALSADSFCSLYSLAIKFDSEMLQTAIQTFVEKSLDFDQAIDFLSCARHHPDKEKVEKLVLLTNSRICGYLVKNPSDAAKVPPTVLAHILHKRSQVLKVLKGGDPKKFSEDWELGRSRLLSSVVANCCLQASCPAVEMSANDERLSRQTFEKLTNPKHLPALNCDAALSLLKVDCILSGDETAKKGQVMSSPPTLSSLEHRCVDAIVSSWTTILAREDYAQLLSMLSAMKASVLAEILIDVSQQYENSTSHLGVPLRHDIDILGSVSSNREPMTRTIPKQPSGFSPEKVSQEERATRLSIDDSDPYDDDSGSLTYSVDRYGVSIEL